MKKILSAVVAVLLIVLSFPFMPVEIDAATLVTGDFKYKTTGSEATITGYYGSDTDIVIPSSIGEYTVTAIGENAFSECESLNSVVISNGIKYIYKNAFFGCKNLSSITIPSSIVDIRNNVFGECYGLESLYIEDFSKWCRINFESATSNPMAYSSDIYINGEFQTATIVIPEGVTSIKQYALDFPNNTRKRIVIPKSVRYIDENAIDRDIFAIICYVGTWEEFESIDFVFDHFWDGDFLCVEDYEIKTNIKMSDDGILYEITEDFEVIIHGFKNPDTTLVIPSKIDDLPVTSIGGYAFIGTKIDSLYIHRDIKHISYNAFELSTANTIGTIYYEGSSRKLKSISNSTFYDRFTIVYIVIPIEGMVLAGGEDFVEIDPRESFTPAFEIYPLNANELITISTLSYSDCINIYNNKITGLKPGEAVVCARSDSGFVYEFTVRVIGYTSLSIDSLPDKLSYGLRSSFDPTGLTVTAHKNNGESNEATEYTVSGYNALKKGKQTVTVTYEGCTASFDVFVSDATVGDANLDGAVSSVDSNYLKRIIVGNMSAEEYTDEFFACDINGDGEINSIDSALLRRSLAGALI